jgi:hypothetical protein
LGNQTQTLKKDYDQRLSLALELDKYRNLIKKKESECTDMMKSSELEQHRHRVELENRANLEAELKKMQLLVNSLIFFHNQFKIRRKSEAFLGKQREASKALKAVRRAKFALDTAKKSIPQYNYQIEELNRELVKEISIAKKESSLVSTLLFWFLTCLA